MLASTVQFSTYDQTPITRPRQTHHRSNRATPRGRWWYEMQTGPDTKQQTHPDHRVPRRTGMVRSLRTQQRAYDPAPSTTPVHTPPKERRTGSRQQPAAELVSVPPSSTTPDACSPSRLTGHRDLGAALDHSPEVSGQCSLERR